MFIHKNREEVTQLPTDHNGVSTIDEYHHHVPPDTCIMVSPNVVERTWV